MEQSAGDSHFTNGSDIHFDYSTHSGSPMPPSVSSASSASKKKKKKKKSKESKFKFEDVTLADPEADYPQSRVIKIGPNGDVIVESLDHEYPQEKLTPPPEPVEDTDYMSVPGKLESSVLRFKDEKERNFWFSLSEDERKKILSIDIDMVTERFNHKLRPLNTKHHGPTHSHDPPGFHTPASSCPTCGRNGKSVQDEIEKAYQPYLDDFVESTWKVSEQNREQSPDSPQYEEESRPPYDDHNQSSNAPAEISASLPDLSKAAKGRFDSEIYDGVKNRIFQAFKRAQINSPNHPNDRVQGALNKLMEAGNRSASEFIDTFQKMDSVSNGDLMDFADSIIHNNGESFINLVEKSKADQEGAAWEDEDEQDAVGQKARLTELEGHTSDLLYSSVYNGQDNVDNGDRLEHDHHKTQDTEDEHEHEHGHDCDHSHSDIDEHSEDEFDAENDEAKALRVEELRGFFMMQAVQIVRDRFRSEFEQKVSEDRTQKFIEELEAEENAKKERELKKLKQKEKQKEKKRLQQLAKEEEKRRKEEEAKQKSEELKKKQEELRAEQARRKEELKKKKEEEKQKKIEALRLKEEAKLRQLEEKKAEKQKLEQQMLAEKQAAKEASKQQSSTPAPEVAASESVVDTTNDFSTADSSAQHGAASSTTEPDFPELSIPVFDQSTNPDTDKLLEQLYSDKPNTSTLPPAFPSIPMGQAQNIPYSPSKQASALLQNSSWGQLDQSAAAGFPTGPTHQFGDRSHGQLMSDVGQVGLAPSWTNSRFGPDFNGATPQQPPSNDIWAPSFSRNNSIWGPSSTAPNSNQASSIWGNNAFRNNVSQPQPFTQQPRDIVPQAAHEAIMTLQKSNEAAFGMASIHKVFQVAKGLLNNNTMGLSEFLRSLNGGTQFHFDIIYDDFGSVTHIKLSGDGSQGPASEPRSEVKQSPSPTIGLVMPSTDTSRAPNVAHGFNGQGPLQPMMHPLQSQFQTSPNRQGASFQAPMMMPQANYGGMNYGLQNPEMGAQVNAGGANSFDLGAPNNLQRPDSSQGPSFGPLKNGIW